MEQMVFGQVTTYDLSGFTLPTLSPGKEFHISSIGGSLHSKVGKNYYH